MTSWIWSVPEETWPLARRDKDLLIDSVSAQIEALDFRRQCENLCKEMQAACDVVEREQKENITSLSLLSEGLSSLEIQFGIVNDLTESSRSEPEAKRPRIVLQDPSVSSTDRNCVSPRGEASDFYEVSDDVVVISESRGWEGQRCLPLEEEASEPGGDCMTLEMATEMLDQDETRPGRELEEECEKEEREEEKESEEREEEDDRQQGKEERRCLPSQTGQRVVARKSSETWWAKGTLMKVASTKSGQTSYRIQFDRGDKGLINPRLIASMDHPQEGDLHMGSRVVGVYAKWNKLYGGIVAETACRVNRNRYLVFYDDGFAQYMSHEELHEVLMPSVEVWKDVANHSRDFIKEYLETYPMRPLLEVNVGDKVNTEWRSTWSLATVIGIDCSLIKMKFNSAREEWIYRGSPRLEPVYHFKDSVDEERGAWILRKGKDSAPTLKELLMAREFPCYMGDHMITCTAMSCEEPDDDITILCVKDGQGRLQSNGMRPQRQQEDLYSHSSAPTISSIQTSQSRALARKSTSKQQATKPSHVTSKPQTTATAIPLTETQTQTTDSPTTRETRLSAGDHMKCTAFAESQWEAPWLNIHLKRNRASDRAVAHPSPEKQRLRHGGKSVRDVASCLLKKLGDDASRPRDIRDDGRVQTEKMRNTWSSLAKQQAVQYMLHECSPSCCPAKDVSPEQLRGLNPLSIPLLMGWKREVTRRLHPHKMDVFYRTPPPCNRRLRCMAEVVEYLCQVAAEDLTADQFTFDDAVSLSTNPAIPNEEPFVYIEDLAMNEEAKPISCVNEIDNEQPPAVKYISSRLTDGVDVNVDTTFLVCCDCTDDCQDKESCACFQLTWEAAEAVGIDCDTDMGYTFRRIENAHRTAIYECNSRCKCSSHCANRVVQNGIQVRLQVFKTQQKGWGVRCLDDIPKGSFMCCYAGQLLTEEDANKEGHRRGDEYIAELDHIEVVEKMKEGYESDVSDCSSSLLSSMSSDGEGLSSLGGQKATTSSNKKEDNDNMIALGHLAAPVWCRVALNISDNDVEKAAEWLKENSAYLPGDSLSESTSHAESSPAESVTGASGKATTGIWSMGSKSESVDSLAASNNNESCEPVSAADIGGLLGGYRVAVKATSGHGCNRSCSLILDSGSREKTTSTPMSIANGTRSLFGDLGCFAVDAKSIGNVGRYLNHSCHPNLFVQNVFVDTHDLRFPWVAFFSKNTIKAMTELTWDYNYEVGSVPGRELNCYCGTAQCRGRLL